MKEAVSIIKHNGKRPSEHFDVSKLHASICAACLSVRSPEGEAETTAKRVCDAVVAWLGNKSEVTSDDIRRIASARLKDFHPEAAYLYKHHRLVI